ncbi:MAG: DUF4962 domain-containing protein [Filimonas sp.]|nr:DUF4962 domain-containing protein [Filimonas sp.]
MKKTTLLLACLTTGIAYSQQQPATIHLTAEKLHARVREWAYPANGITVPDNSPALLWPGTDGKHMILPMEIGSELESGRPASRVIYKVMLATDKEFKKDLVESGEQRWAVYPLHRSLAPAHWYWKYGYTVKGSNKWAWSPVYDFVVAPGKKDAQVSPPVSEMLKRNEGPHPRLWNMHTIGEIFYKNNLQNPEAKTFIAFAEKLMKEPLPKEQPMRVIDTTGKNELEKKKIIERMYHGFGDKVGTPVRNLCIAYQLTKDERFIKDAKVRALNIAKMDPDGLATHDDFTSGAVLEALGWFYDAGYFLLSNDEKELFKKVITIRAKRVYDDLPNRFELHACDNHVWQITMRNLAIGTVAVVNEVPEATEWLSYLYEVWCARYPILGTTDGGWHEGNGYFRVSYKSFIYLSQMFGDFSGVNYFNKAWMQNLPYFMLYTYPPASPAIPIGDMWENVREMVKMQAWFADALTYKIDNPYLNWYVDAIKKERPEYFRGTDDLLLFRLLNYNPKRQLPVASPGELPKTHAFTDIGVVAMQENLADAGNSLSSYLFSNPFGSSGHGHAAQNAFAVSYKGKTIFGGSGYYSNFSDKHNLLDYRSARGHSTILVDSLGQRLGEEGYGWIPRAISGKAIQYALGDASNAYGNIKSEFWLDRFRQIKVKPDQANGYGDVGVKLYRRHMLQLEGGYIVLYDELEAAKPVKWTTQFHSPYVMLPGQQVDAKQQSFSLENSPGKINATVFANTPLQLSVHDQFSEAAVNWAKVTDDEGNIKDFKKQWHAGITSLPSATFRYLTIIQVKDKSVEVIKVVEAKDGLYHLQVGQWDILAQLDGSKAPALQVTGTQSNAAFNYGILPVTLLGSKYTATVPGSSMLLEKDGKTIKRTEVTDTLPDVAKYDYAPGKRPY